MHFKKLAILFFLFYSFHCFSQDKVTTSGIPGDVNGKYQDVRPIISDEGDKLYLTRRYHPDNVKGTKDFQDVWVSRYDQRGIWLKPKNLGKKYNDKRANDLIRANADSMIFINTKYKGVSTELALFRNGKEDAEELKIEGFYNKSPYVDYDYNFNHKIIIMAVERNDSKGDQDLYFSEYDEQTQNFTTPKNMGSKINSKKADFAPFLTKDGRTIFFASYGHGGRGNSDLYMSHRLSEAWDDWSEPVNLGEVINTPNEETFVSIDPSFDYLYYDSYPAGAKNRDIWRATLSSAIKEDIVAAKNQSFKSIQGVNAATANTEDMPSVDSALVDSESYALAENDNTEVVKQPAPMSENESTSEFDTPKPKKTEEEKKQEAKAKNLSDSSKAILARKEDSKSFIARVGESLGFGSSDKPIGFVSAGSKGIQVTENVYFGFDSDKVDKSYDDLLVQIADILRKEPEYKLLIEGHTDGVGGEDVNIDLSCRRSKQVRKLLIDKGINRYRLEISCEGKERPLASNDDEVQGRELNRRVEFYLY